MRQAGEARCFLGSQSILLWSAELREAPGPSAEVGTTRGHLRPARLCLQRGRGGQHWVHPLPPSWGARLPAGCLQPAPGCGPSQVGLTGGTPGAGEGSPCGCLSGLQCRASRKRKASHRPLSGDPRQLRDPSRPACAQGVACVHRRRPSPLLEPWPHTPGTEAR